MKDIYAKPTLQSAAGDECIAQQQDINMDETCLSHVVGGVSLPPFRVDKPATVREIYGLINESKKGQMSRPAAITQVFTGTLMGFGACSAGEVAGTKGAKSRKEDMIKKTNEMKEALKK